LVASPPCQPYSAAGIRCGGTDDRNGMEATVNLITATRPVIAIIENVPSMMDDMFSDHVQPLLLNLRNSGYAVRATIHSCTLYGVPQRRQRLLITCIRTDISEMPEPKLALEKTTADRPPTAKDALSDDSLWKGRRPDSMRITLSTIRARMRMRKENEVTGLVTAFQASPSVIGTSLKDSSYHRLLAVPDDVSIDKVRYGGLRALQTKHVLTLQSFPQDFVLYGHRLFQSLCIGNAVPPMLAHSLGKALEVFLGQHPPPRAHVSGEMAATCLDKLKRELIARIPVV
jgi:DNA (cytosine-5)-methyltransferase 1